MGSPASRLEWALAQAPMTAGLSPTERARLAAMAVLRSVRKGQLLFSEGEACAGLHLVVEGTVKIFKLSADGREKVLHVFPPAETFAEGALFGDGRYPAHAQALAAGVVACLPRQPFLQFLRSDPTIGFRMLGAMAARLKLLAHRIEQVSFQSAAARLAFYLLDNLKGGDRRFALRLTLSKKELAGLLGMSAETLSRILAALRESGILSVRGRSLAVLDPERLRTVAVGGTLPEV